MQPLKRLAQLYLSHNFLSVIESTYFRYNVALTNLHLDNNHISSIDSTAFRGVPKLRALRLDNNNLKTIDRGLFASLTSLTELHLQVQPPLLFIYVLYSFIFHHATPRVLTKFLTTMLL